MIKPFKAYQEQIDGLISKGLIIDDVQDAISFLQAENYYTVINGYKEPFIDNNGNYVDGASFDHIKQLFLFNRDLRSVVLRYSLIIENSIKSIIAYEFEKRHNTPNSYLDYHSYNSSKDRNVINKQIAIIKKIIDDKKVYEGPVKHYFDNYDSLPLWILVKYMTIGNISYFYALMDDAARNDVAKTFYDRYKQQYPCSNFNSRFSADDLQAAIKAINLVRNVCAHGERLYNIKFSNIRCRALRRIIGFNFSNTSLALIFAIFKFFLTEEYFDEFSKITNSVFDKYFPLFNTDIDSSIMNCMGLDDNTFKFLFIG